MTKVETLIGVHGDVLKHRYSIGWPVQRIAVAVGYDRKVVERALKAMNVTLRRQGKYHYWLRVRYADEIVREYELGASTIVIGKRYRVSQHTIGAILREEGITLRRQNPPKLQPDHRILEAVLSGQPQYKLAAQFGIGRGSMQRREELVGVPSRRSPRFELWRQRMLAERAREAA